MRGLAVITRFVVDRGGHRQRALAQRGQIGCRNIQRPRPVVRDGCGVGFAAQRYGDGLTRLRAGRAAHGQRLLCFCRVQHIVSRQRRNAHDRRSGIHADAVGRRRAVARAVLRRHGHLIARAIGQGAHVCGRNGGRPAAVAMDGGRIALAVQRHGDLRTAGELGAGAVNHQGRTGFSRVDDVIAAEGIDGQRHGGRVHYHIVGLGAAVARAVGNRRAEGHGAVVQRGNHAGRHAHAPVTAGVNGGGVLVRTDGDDQLIADARAGCRAADDLRLPVLHAVDDVIARDGVKADGRRRGIKRNRFARAARVTRGVAHADLHGVAVIRQRGQVGARHVHAPDTALLHLRGIALTAQRHGDRLPDFRRGGAGNGHARSRFAAVNHVIASDGIDAHGWRGRIHAVLAARRGAVAVRVGDAHLHAGIAVLQAREIGGRHGGRPVTVGIDFRSVRLAAEGDGNGLVFLHVRGAAGQHQIRAFLRRVNHVVGGNRIDADSHC